MYPSVLLKPHMVGKGDESSLRAKRKGEGRPSVPPRIQWLSAISAGRSGSCGPESRSRAHWPRRSSARTAHRDRSPALGRGHGSGAARGTPHGRLRLHGLIVALTVLIVLEEAHVAVRIDVDARALTCLDIGLVPRLLERGEAEAGEVLAIDRGAARKGALDGRPRLALAVGDGIRLAVGLLGSHPFRGGNRYGPCPCSCCSARSWFLHHAN